MNKHIITRNIYLEIALRNLMDKYYTYIDYIMIDLDSSSSLKEIALYTVLSNYFRCKLFLVGSKGIYSELFSSFNVIDLNQSLHFVRSKLIDSKSVNPDEICAFIESVKKLDRLTQGQIKLCLLDRMQELRLAPAVMSLNTSSVYRNIWLAAKKLNFSSLLNFRTFIANEYSNEELIYLL